MFITGARPPRHGSIGSGRDANPATIGLRVRGRQEVNYQPRHLAWTRDASNAELSRSKTTPHCHHDRGERKTGLPTNVRNLRAKRPSGTFPVLRYTTGAEACAAPLPQAAGSVPES